MAKRKVKPLNFKVGKHHWVGIKPNPEKYLGFIYEICNNVNGMRYIGRKQYWHMSKGKRKKQGDWNFYTGSSKRLNKDIKDIGITNFTFKILRHYETKSGLRFGEIEEIVKRNALTLYDEDGIPIYYNGTVDKAYRPVEYYQGRRRIRK